MLDQPQTTDPTLTDAELQRANLTRAMAKVQAKIDVINVTVLTEPRVEEVVRLKNLRFDLYRQRAMIAMHLSRDPAMGHAPQTKAEARLKAAENRRRAADTQLEAARVKAEAKARNVAATNSEDRLAYLCLLEHLREHHPEDMDAVYAKLDACRSAHRASVAEATGLGLA